MRKYSDAKRAEIDRRLLIRHLDGGAPLKSRTSGAYMRERHDYHPFRVEAVGATGTGGRRRKYAELTVAGAVTGFHDPLNTLSKWIRDETDSTKQPSKVRVLDPKTVTCAAPKFATHAEHVSGKDAMKRIQAVHPGRFLRMWRRPQALGRADFFLFPDCVLFQSWTPDSGWQTRRVPEEGLAL
jgi:hypothetical protein